MPEGQRHSGGVDSVHVQGAAQRILPHETVAASTLPHAFLRTSPASPPRKQVVPPEHSMWPSAVEHRPASSQDFGAQHARASHASNSISTSKGSQLDGLKFLPVLPVGLHRVHGRGNSTAASSESHAAMHAPDVPATPTPNQTTCLRDQAIITDSVRGLSGAKRVKAHPRDLELGTERDTDEKLFARDREDTHPLPPRRAEQRGEPP